MAAGSHCTTAVEGGCAIWCKGVLCRSLSHWSVLYLFSLRLPRISSAEHLAHSLWKGQVEGWFARKGLRPDGSMVFTIKGSFE